MHSIYQQMNRNKKIKIKLIKLNKKTNSVNQDKSHNYLQNIKSKYVLKIIFGNLKKNKFLKIINHSKKIQNKLGLDITDYIQYKKIKLDIIPIKDAVGPFININKEEDKFYYHIYFNDNEEEMKRNYLNEKDKVTKIRIIIDNEIQSFQELFKNCNCIEYINFIWFYRSDILNMNSMFYGCYSLKEINNFGFDIINVTDLSYMFFKCYSLIKLNLSKFQTSNATNMRNMFYECTSLKELNLSNFNTSKVTDMAGMFFNCCSLKKLNLSNFNTNQVINMKSMFYECSLLEELDISSNFNFNNVTNMDYMFSGCKKLKRK